MSPLGLPHPPGEWRQERALMWRRLDTPSLELCQLWVDDARFLIRGQVLSGAGGTPRSVAYHVLCSGEWATEYVRVRVVTGSETAELHLSRDAGGTWLRNQTERLDRFSDLIDIDLGFTPSTNTLPIRRLRPAIGECVEVNALWVRFPDLTLEVLPQSYTRSSADRYLYESNGGRFQAELVVDSLGLVSRYERLFETVAAL